MSIEIGEGFKSWFPDLEKQKKLEEIYYEKFLKENDKENENEVKTFVSDVFNIKFKYPHYLLGFKITIEHYNPESIRITISKNKHFFANNVYLCYELSEGSKVEILKSKLFSIFVDFLREQFIKSVI